MAVIAKCYGRDLGRESGVSMGESVGVIATPTIGKPITQLTMPDGPSTLGVLSRAAATSRLRRNLGAVRFTDNLRFRHQCQGREGCDYRSGEIIILMRTIVSVNAIRFPYGAVPTVDAGKTIKAGTKLATWDPYPPIVTEYAGTVRFER